VCSSDLEQATSPVACSIAPSQSVRGRCVSSASASRGWKDIDSLRSRKPERAGLYARTLRDLCTRGALDPSMRVLVAAGAAADRDVFLSLGFRDVTITNLDDPGDYAPYHWEHQDAEALSYDDDSFDWAVVSAGLHHCRSPHRALLELYRVARRGVLGIESRDSVLLRAAVRTRLIDEYELPAVAANDFRAGGVRNTAVPNYVYRWTEREVEKTIRSHAPHARHEFLWFHELEVPASLVTGWTRRVLLTLEPAGRALARAFPSQANLFGFAVLKHGGLQPWLRPGEDGPMPDKGWIRARLRL